MDSKDIIKNIEDFFKTADANALAEVDAAFSIEIDGDISIEEYLGGFSSEYFYASSPSNIYTYTDKHLIPSGQYGRLKSFENTKSNYEESDLVMPLKTKSETKGQVAKMTKLAA